MSDDTRRSKVVIDYQQLFNALPGRYIAFLPDYPTLTIAAENQEHAKVADVKPADIIGRPMLEVFPDTSEKYLKTGVSELAESLHRALKTGEPDRMETLRYDLKNASGTFETRYWRVTHYPVKDASGTVQLLFQATRDITQETVDSQMLEETQQQLNEALAAGSIGTWKWDVAADKVVGDANMAAMFGVSAKEAADGLPLSVFTGAMHPEDRARVQESIAKAMQSGSMFHNEYRTVGKDGSIHWLIARGRLERDDQGNTISFPGVLVDITDRKLMENNMSFLARAGKALASSLDYNRTLQTVAQLVVPDIADWCTVDILDDNGALQQVALSHKDPKKIEWALELRRKQGPPDLSEPHGIAKVIRTGKPEFYPYISPEVIEASAPDEEQRKLLKDLSLTSLIVVPLKLHKKTIGAITLISTERKRMYTPADLEMAEELAARASLAITNSDLYENARKELAERSRLEEQLRQANEKLEERVRQRTHELNESNLNLQRSNQELQDFAYVASHDLQEPLRKIQAFGNLLEAEYAAELGEGGDYLQRMRSAAARMSALIEDILSFSRVTTKGREFVSVDLRQIAREVISDLEIRIAETKGVIEIGDLPTIQADPTQMRQLLQNLIANALKFHRDGVPPRIELKATKVTDNEDKKSKITYCRLEVSDNGLGFDEKYLDRIFAVFQRLHSRENYEGTGIGLAVCRKIVERHGGTITATSKPGKGSTFIITIPLRHKKGEQLS